MGSGLRATVTAGIEPKAKTTSARQRIMTPIIRRRVKWAEGSSRIRGSGSQTVGGIKQAGGASNDIIASRAALGQGAPTLKHPGTEVEFKGSIPCGIRYGRTG